MSLKDELVALGTAVMTTEQVMTENKGLCVKIDKVFMPPGTYPRQIIPKKE
jgi:H/ACA ribonucleoprotein complex subunit 4